MLQVKLIYYSKVVLSSSMPCLGIFILLFTFGSCRSDPGLERNLGLNGMVHSLNGTQSPFSSSSKRSPLQSHLDQPQVNPEKIYPGNHI